MDVVTAIEGGTNPFQCTEIRQRGAGQTGAPAEFAHPCGISMAMRKAELAWRLELANQTLANPLSSAHCACSTISSIVAPRAVRPMRIVPPGVAVRLSPNDYDPLLARRPGR
jgi:hypothetical protein